MGIAVRHKGSFRKAEKFLHSSSRQDYLRGLDILAKEGVSALAAATPQRSGGTADSWDYDILNEHGSYKIVWTNRNVNEGVNIAVILQLGHGTRTGGYVTGVDYINPALSPIFDKIAEAAWEVVRS